MISRIFRGENENAAVKRKRQIDTLKIFNDNVLELKEDVEYQVQFYAGNHHMAINVSLSPEFPLEKPVLRVSPPINHMWCNEHSEIISAPGLLNFTIYSDLGRVVQAIIREFSKNPPQLLEDNSVGSATSHIDLQERGSPSYTTQHYSEPSSSFNSYYNSQYPPFSSSSTNACIYNYNYTSSGNVYASDNHAKQFGSTPSQHSSYVGNSSRNASLHCTNTSYNANQHGTGSSYLNAQYTNFQHSLSDQSQSKPQPQSIVFPELNDLSNEELKLLMEDEDRQDEFLEKHSQLKNMNSAIEDAMNGIEKTANDNLVKEPDFKELCVDVNEKVKSITMLKAKYDQLIQKYNKLSEAFMPDHIKNCLSIAADESHEASEKIADDFLNRKIDVERFLSTYIECRKLGQARRTKEEKLAHQLNELKRAGY